MLRITAEYTDVDITMKLEGKIKGPWVDELESCWMRLKYSAPAKPLRLDLTGISFLAPEGKALICKMADAGVELIASGLAAQTILDEVHAYRNQTRRKHVG